MQTMACINNVAFSIGNYCYYGLTFWALADTLCWWVVGGGGGGGGVLVDSTKLPTTKLGFKMGFAIQG